MITAIVEHHWYKSHISVCPVCGREKIWAERQYTERPKNRLDRVSITETYDGCQGY